MTEKVGCSCDGLYWVRQIHNCSLLSIYSPSSVVIVLSNIDHSIEPYKICPTIEAEMVISDCVQELPSPPLGPHRNNPQVPPGPPRPPAEGGTRITSLSGLHLQRSTPHSRPQSSTMCNASNMKTCLIEQLNCVTVITGYDIASRNTCFI